MGWVPGSDGARPNGVAPTRSRVSTQVARWDSTPDICDLIDAVVLGESSDADAASQLVAVEVWCKYLRELLRDTGRYNTRSAIVANQAAELQERLR